MMNQELSIVRFCVYNFFGILMNSRPFQPVSTTLIKLVESLIESEPNPDQAVRDRIRWIYNHTHERVDMPLAVVELLVFRNLDKGINREIEIAEKTFYLSELYAILDEISKELTNTVVEIAKKYSLDIPIGGFNTKQVMEIGN